MGNKNLIFQIWHFLKERKMWWLLPLIIMLIVIGFLVVLSQSSALSAFIYALF